jgi:hypothetical protein
VNARRLLLLVMTLWAASLRLAGAQTFTVDSHFASFTKPDCSDLSFYANESINVVVYAQAKWTLLRDGVQVDQKIDNYYGFFSSPIFITFTRPAEAGSYTMVLDTITRQQTYPIINVTLAHPSPTPCTLGTFDTANCLYRPVPPGGFIFDNSFYVPPTATKNCAVGSFDTANCLLMPEPSGGFIFNNAFYVRPGGTPKCPPTVDGYKTNFDGANCYILTAPWGTSAFLFDGNWYTTPLRGCPAHTTFDGANCLVAAAPAGSSAFEFEGSWYTTPVWCN